MSPRSSTSFVRQFQLYLENISAPLSRLEPINRVINNIQIIPYISNYMGISKTARDTIWVKWEKSSASLVGLSAIMNNSTPSQITWTQIKELIKHLAAFCNRPTPKEDWTRLVECLVSYIRIIMEFNHLNPGETIREHIYAITECFTLVPDVLASVQLKNQFVLDATPELFSDFILETHDIWCKRQLLKTYIECVEDSDKEARVEIGKKQDYDLYRLIDALAVTGDFDTQSTILEIIFRVYSGHIRGNKNTNFIPNDPILNGFFVAGINADTFDEDIRKFLNAFNTGKDTVFSVPCKYVIFGKSSKCKPPAGLDVIWVDFNLQPKTVTWYCDRFSVLENPTENDKRMWTLVTLFETDVKSLAIKRTNENIMILEIIYTEACLSTPRDTQRFFDIARKKLYLFVNNTYKDTKLISKVLPYMFGSKFKHTPTTVERTRPPTPVYRPLKIKVSRRCSTVSTVSVGESTRSSSLNIVPIKNDKCSKIQDENLDAQTTASRELGQVSKIDDVQMETFSELLDKNLKVSNMRVSQPSISVSFEVIPKEKCSESLIEKLNASSGATGESSIFVSFEDNPKEKCSENLIGKLPNVATGESSISVCFEDIPKEKCSENLFEKLNASSVAPGRWGRRSNMTLDDIISIPDSDANIPTSPENISIIQQRTNTPIPKTSAESQTANFETAPLIIHNNEHFSKSESPKNRKSTSKNNSLSLQEPEVTSSKIDTSLDEDIRRLEVLTGLCSDKSVDYQKIINRSHNSQQSSSQESSTPRINLGTPGRIFHSSPTKFSSNTEDYETALETNLAVVVTPENHSESNISVAEIGVQRTKEMNSSAEMAKTVEDLVRLTEDITTIENAKKVSKIICPELNKVKPVSDKMYLQSQGLTLTGRNDQHILDHGLIVKEKNVESNDKDLKSRELILTPKNTQIIDRDLQSQGLNLTRKYVQSNDKENNKQLLINTEVLPTPIQVEVRSELIENSESKALEASQGLTLTGRNDQHLLDHGLIVKEKNVESNDKDLKSRELILTPKNTQITDRDLQSQGLTLTPKHVQSNDKENKQLLINTEVLPTPIQVEVRSELIQNFESQDSPIIAPVGKAKRILQSQDFPSSSGENKAGNYVIPLSSESRQGQRFSEKVSESSEEVIRVKKHRQRFISEKLSEDSGSTVFKKKRTAARPISPSEPSSSDYLPDQQVTGTPDQKKNIVEHSVKIANTKKTRRFESLSDSEIMCPKERSEKNIDEYKADCKTLLRKKSNLRSLRKVELEMPRKKTFRKRSAKSQEKPKKTAKSGYSSEPEIIIPQSVAVVQRSEKNIDVTEHVKEYFTRIEMPQEKTLRKSAKGQETERSGKKIDEPNDGQTGSSTQSDIDIVQKIAPKKRSGKKQKKAFSNRTEKTMGETKEKPKKALESEIATQSGIETSEKETPSERSEKNVDVTEPIRECVKEIEMPREKALRKKSAKGREKLKKVVESESSAKPKIILPQKVVLVERSGKNVDEPNDGQSGSSTPSDIEIPQNTEPRKRPGKEQKKTFWNRAEKIIGETNEKPTETVNATQSGIESSEKETPCERSEKLSEKPITISSESSTDGVQTNMNLSQKKNITKLYTNLVEPKLCDKVIPNSSEKETFLRSLELETQESEIIIPQKQVPMHRQDESSYAVSKEIHTKPTEIELVKTASGQTYPTREELLVSGISQKSEVRIPSQKKTLTERSVDNQDVTIKEQRKKAKELKILIQSDETTLVQKQLRTEYLQNEFESGSSTQSGIISLSQKELSSDNLQKSKLPDAQFPRDLIVSLEEAKSLPVETGIPQKLLIVKITPGDIDNADQKLELIQRQEFVEVLDNVAFEQGSDIYEKSSQESQNNVEPMFTNQEPMFTNQEHIDVEGDVFEKSTEKATSAQMVQENVSEISNQITVEQPKKLDHCGPQMSTSVLQELMRHTPEKKDMSQKECFVDDAEYSELIPLQKISQISNRGIEELGPDIEDNLIEIRSLSHKAGVVEKKVEKHVSNTSEESETSSEKQYPTTEKGHVDIQNNENPLQGSSNEKETSDKKHQLTVKNPPDIQNRVDDIECVSSTSDIQQQKEKAAFETTMFSKCSSRRKRKLYDPGDVAFLEDIHETDIEKDDFGHDLEEITIGTSRKDKSGVTSKTTSRRDKSAATSKATTRKDKSTVSKTTKNRQTSSRKSNEPSYRTPRATFMYKDTRPRLTFRESKSSVYFYSINMQSGQKVLNKVRKGRLPFDFDEVLADLRHEFESVQTGMQKVIPTRSLSTKRKLNFDKEEEEETSKSKTKRDYPLRNKSNMKTGREKRFKTVDLGDGFESNDIEFVSKRPLKKLDFECSASPPKRRTLAAVQVRDDSSGKENSPIIAKTVTAKKKLRLFSNIDTDSPLPELDVEFDFDGSKKRQTESQEAAYIKMPKPKSNKTKPKSKKIRVLSDVVVVKPIDHEKKRVFEGIRPLKRLASFGDDEGRKDQEGRQQVLSEISTNFSRDEVMHWVETGNMSFQT